MRVRFSRLQWQLIVAVLAGGLSLGVAPAGAQVRAVPPPDFSHPDSPHFDGWTPTSATGMRPVLVLIADFNDAAHPITASDAASVNSRLFGPSPSVADYYTNQSRGRFTIAPAAETSGVRDDGVVTVPINMPEATYRAMAIGDRAATIIGASAPWVQWSSLDANGDRMISPQEVAIVEMVYTAVDTGGGVRAMNSGAVVQGITVDSDAVPMNVIGVGTGAGRGALTHELWHQMFQMPDLYDHGTGWFDISGDALGDAQPGMATFETLHLGWYRPPVALSDGYLTLGPANTTAVRRRPHAAILYDPARGADDYFIVENRQKTANTYDSVIPDSGLLIWRMDERGFKPVGIRPMEIMRPDGQPTPPCINANCYGGLDTDAWDPCDPHTTARDMTRSWRDGSSANVAVRAIGRSGSAITAYFDTRGPGVLVDPFTLDGGCTGQPRALVPNQPNEVVYRVRNTGEEADTFDFSVDGMPTGWTATTQTIVLQPGEESFARLSVTPASWDPNAADTITLKAVGRNEGGTIISRAPFRVQGPPSLRVSDARIVEGNTGRVYLQFEITLSKPAPIPVSLDILTTNGTATAPADYSPLTTGANFPAGSRKLTPTVPIVGDVFGEPDETFRLRVANVVNARVEDGTGVGTIVNDDVYFPGLVNPIINTVIAVTKPLTDLLSRFFPR